MFKEELNIDEIGLEENLLTIGLNSVTIVKLAGDLDKLYPGKVSIADMYKFQTIREISDYIDSKENITLKGIKLKSDYISDNNECVETVLEIDEKIISIFKDVSKEQNCSIEDVIIGVCIFVLSKINDVSKFSVEVMNDVDMVKEAALDLEETEDLYSIAKHYKEQCQNADNYKLSSVNNLKKGMEYGQKLLLIYDYLEKTEGLNEFEIAVGLEKQDAGYKVHFSNNESLKREVIDALPDSVESVLNQIKSLVNR